MIPRAIARPKASRVLTFPYKGLHQGAPGAAQPEGTTYSCLNVMPRDRVQDRATGGPRPGLATLANIAAVGTDGIFRLHTMPDRTDLTKTFLVAITGHATHKVYGAHGAMAGLAEVTYVAGATVVANLAHTCDVNGVVYCVDGTNTVSITPSAGIADLAALTAAAGKGTMPTGCTICANYDGRLALAGQTGAITQIWFSRVLDPTDWLFSDTDVLAACPLNSSPSAGRIAKPVTALCPIGRQLVIGATTALYRLDGNPMDGSRVQLLSDSVGILGKDAWCTDEGNTLYFMGSSGFYRLLPDAPKPENLTHGVADRFMRIMAGYPGVAGIGPFHLIYDSVNMGVWVFSNGTVQIDGVYYSGFFYSTETEGIFPMKFPGVLPCAALWSDLNGAQTQLIVGRSDYGSMYAFDRSTLVDMGTNAITATVAIGPLRPSGALGESVCTALDFVPGTVTGTFSMPWTLSAAKSEPLLFSGTTQRTMSGTITSASTTPGRVRSLLRLSGGAFALAIGGVSSNWCLDHVVPTFAKGGRQR
jgi:hypothetical protein